MGQTGNKPEYTLTRYSLQRKNNQLGLSVVLDKNTGIQYLMQQRTYSSSNDMQSQRLNFQKRKGILNDNILSLVQVLQNSQKTLCSQMHHLTLVYEYASHSLHQQIQVRIKQDKFFEQKQLISVACSVTLAMAFLQKQKIMYGRLSAMSVFVTEDGFIKISDPQIARSVSALNMVMPNAPQGNNQLELKSCAKADIFSLGIIMLCASLLINIESCYDHLNSPLHDQIKKHLLRIKQRYTQQWISIIQICLSWIPYQRPDFIQLQKKLQKVFNQQDYFQDKRQTAQLQRKGIKLMPGNQKTTNLLIKQIFAETPKQIGNGHRPTYKFVSQIQQKQVGQIKRKRTHSNTKGLNLTSKQDQNSKQKPRKSTPGLGLYQYRKQNKNQLSTLQNKKALQTPIQQLSQHRKQVQIKPPSKPLQQFALFQNTTITNNMQPKYSDESKKQFKVITKYLQYPSELLPNYTNNKQFKINVRNSQHTQIKHPMQGAQQYKQIQFKKQVKFTTPQNYVEPTILKIQHKRPLQPLQNNYNTAYQSQKVAFQPEIHKTKYEQQKVQSNMVVQPFPVTTIANPSYLPLVHNQSIQGLNMNAGIHPNRNPDMTGISPQIQNIINLYQKSQLTQYKQDTTYQQKHYRFNKKNSLQKPFQQQYQRHMESIKPAGVTQPYNKPVINSNPSQINEKDYIRNLQIQGNKQTSSVIYNEYNIPTKWQKPINHPGPYDSLHAIHVPNIKIDNQNMFKKNQVSRQIIVHKPYNHQINQVNREGQAIQLVEKKNIHFRSPTQPNIHYIQNQQNNIISVPASARVHYDSEIGSKQNQYPKHVQRLSGDMLEHYLQESRKKQSLYKIPSIKLKQASTLKQDPNDQSADLNGPQMIDGVNDPSIDDIAQNRNDSFDQQSQQHQNNHIQHNFDNRFRKRKQLQNKICQRSSLINPPSGTSVYVVQQYKHGAKYQGWKVDGMRQGHGKFFYQDGGLYCGMWKENKMDGQGILYYCNGKPAYDGQWKADKFNGFGILYNQTPQQLNSPFNYQDFNNIGSYWHRYQGDFFDDNKQGKGALHLTNGQIFIGIFKQDSISGRGIFNTMGGRQINGTWIDNRMTV